MSLKWAGDAPEHLNLKSSNQRISRTALVAIARIRQQAGRNGASNQSLL